MIVIELFLSIVLEGKKFEMTDFIIISFLLLSIEQNLRKNYDVNYWKKDVKKLKGKKNLQYRKIDLRKV